MWNAQLEVNLAITRYEQTIFVLLAHHQKCILYFSPFIFFSFNTNSLNNRQSAIFLSDQV